MEEQCKFKQLKTATVEQRKLLEEQSKKTIDDLEKAYQKSKKEAETSMNNLKQALLDQTEKLEEIHKKQENQELQISQYKNSVEGLQSELQNQQKKHEEMIHKQQEEFHEKRIQDLKDILEIQSKQYNGFKEQMEAQNRLQKLAQISSMLRTNNEDLITNLLTHNRNNNDDDSNDNDTTSCTLI